MSKAEATEAMILAGLRVAACLAVMAAAYGVVIHTIESIYQFDPNYLGEFLMTRYLRPFVILLMGLVVWKTAPAVARHANPYKE